MPKFLWVLIMDFRSLLSVVSNLLHSDLPLCDVMPSKAKVNQKRLGCRYVQEKRLMQSEGF